MRIHIFEQSQRLGLPAERAFEFFSDARNLEAITPPWLSFSLLGVDPGAMQAGALIDYRLRLHGLPLRWRTRISVWEPPRRFVDVQIKEIGQHGFDTPIPDRPPLEIPEAQVCAEKAFPGNRRHGPVENIDETPGVFPVGIAAHGRFIHGDFLASGGDQRLQFFSNQRQQCFRDLVPVPVFLIGQQPSAERVGSRHAGF